MPKEANTELGSGFLYNEPVNHPEALIKQARTSNPKDFIIVRATGSTVLETAQKAHAYRLINPILVGEKELIERDAKQINWSFKNIEIIDTSGEEEAITASVNRFKLGGVAGLLKGHLHTDVFMGGLVKKRVRNTSWSKACSCFCYNPAKRGTAIINK